MHNDEAKVELQMHLKWAIKAAEEIDRDYYGAFWRVDNGRSRGVGYQVREKFLMEIIEKHFHESQDSETHDHPEA